MKLARAALSSRRGRILLGLLAAWLAWQAWLVLHAPSKVAGGFPERQRVNALITLPFLPERFHILIFQRFGRGSGHPAKLNFGDCLAYAAATVLDEPLLFKGEDFTHTDVRDARAEAAR